MTQIIRHAGQSQVLRTTSRLRTIALSVSFALTIGGSSVAETIATSVGDYSGVQGQDGWSYGYYDRTADPDKTYSATEFVPFPPEFWNGVAWDWPDGNPPWTSVSIDRAHPSGAPGPDGDRLAVLAAWGPCDGCPKDLLCDGNVGFADVLAVIGTWGACR